MQNAKFVTGTPYYKTFDSEKSDETIYLGQWRGKDRGLYDLYFRCRPLQMDNQVWARYGNAIEDYVMEHFDNAWNVSSYAPCEAARERYRLHYSSDNSGYPYVRPARRNDETVLTSLGSGSYLVELREQYDGTRYIALASYPYSDEYYDEHPELVLCYQEIHRFDPDDAQGIANNILAVLAINDKEIHGVG